MTLTHEAAVRQPEFSWTGREVVREINDGPHLLLRVEIRGGYFPLRAPEPFVRIIREDGTVEESWFAEVAEDHTALRGYFAPATDTAGVLEFGYGHQVMGRTSQSFAPKAVERLDRARLPREVVEPREMPIQGREKQVEIRERP
ncbi:MAG TPA: hypothetical protein VEQ60_26685 [Longimicrobium sp.]|nr:hypothetical protein [Longimicrobium sp.]